MNSSNIKLIAVAIIAFVISVAPGAYAYPPSGNCPSGINNSIPYTSDAACLLALESTNPGCSTSSHCWQNTFSTGGGSPVCNIVNSASPSQYADGTCCFNPGNNSTYCGSSFGVCCNPGSGPQGGFCPNYLTQNWAICPTGAIGQGPQRTNDFSFGCNANLYADINHCGDCSTVCSTFHNSPSCSTGNCVLGTCTGGFGDCDGLVQNGCESNLQTNLLHCGNCATSCPTPANAASATCTTGTCGFTCNSGYADCTGAAGCETHIAVDPNHCGTTSAACSNACPTTTLHINTASCTAGVCGVSTCAAGYGNCDGVATNGCETNLLGADVNNCGTSACGNVCPACPGSSSICTAGVCGCSGCPAGSQTCSAGPCATMTATDVNNCGACNVACSGQNITKTCAAGVCSGACATGFADCDGDKQSNGCEVNLRTDAANCGACGTTCAIQHAPAVCTAGVCGYVACLAGFSDCDGDTLNGCETTGACPVDMAMTAAPQDMAMPAASPDLSAAAAAGADMADSGTKGNDKSGCAIGGSAANAPAFLLLLLALLAAFKRPRARRLAA